MIRAFMSHIFRFHSPPISVVDNDGKNVTMMAAPSALPIHKSHLPRFPWTFQWYGNIVFLRERSFRAATFYHCPKTVKKYIHGQLKMWPEEGTERSKINRIKFYDYHRAKEEFSWIFRLQSREACRECRGGGKERIIKSFTRNCWANVRWAKIYSIDGFRKKLN